MQRRPWPLVFLALLQIFGPLGSIAISAYVNKVGVLAMAIAIWKYSRFFDLVEFYALPILQGGLIFFAKRFGYYAVIALAAFSSYLNFMEWKLASEVISVPILIAVSCTNLALIGYLLIPSVRAVFMNPRLRWWETPPRYAVSIKGQASKTDGHPYPCKLIDLSAGGAGIQTESAIFGNNESLLLTFEHDSRMILMRAVIVHGRPDGSGHRYGLEWQRGSEEDEKRFILLLDQLEINRAPIMRVPPKWKEDLLAWWKRAKRSPAAWVPEVPRKK